MSVGDPNDNDIYYFVYDVFGLLGNRCYIVPNLNDWFGFLFNPLLFLIGDYMLCSINEIVTPKYGGPILAASPNHMMVSVNQEGTKFTVWESVSNQLWLYRKIDIVPCLMPEEKPLALDMLVDRAKVLLEYKINNKFKEAPVEGTSSHDEVKLKYLLN